MRLFTCIELTESIQKELDSWIPDRSLLRKPKPEQLHLTLLFLGECTPYQKDDIIRELENITVEPFELKIEDMGAFPDQKNPRVIWAGVEMGPKLTDLQQNVLDSLSGYIPDNQKKRFKPHITLARVKGDMNSRTKAKIFQPHGPLKLKVDHLTLKKSTLKSSGSEHHVVWRSG